MPTGRKTLRGARARYESASCRPSDELVVILFAILDGYDHTGGQESRLRLLSFFAAFARRHPPAVEAFVATAT